MTTFRSKIFRNLSINSGVTLLIGLSMLIFTPFYLDIGGSELLGVVGFYLGITIFCQFLDGGYSITATRVLAIQKIAKIFGMLKVDL